MGRHPAKQFQGLFAHIKAIVAVRYPELVIHEHKSLQIGHCVKWSNGGTRGFPCCLLGCTQAPPQRSGRYSGFAGIPYVYRRDVRQGTTSQLPVLFFFRPTPYGSCQVVYQSGQPVAFCKFPELRQWQHHHDDNVHQKELGWIDT